MTRGRKPIEAAEAPVELNTAAVAQAQTAADNIARETEAVMHFEEVLRQAGQIESFEFMRRVADCAIAQVFENIRQSGKYKGLPYRDASGDLRHVASLDEFCEHKLGKSYRRCMDLSQNLRLLGPELYEASEKLGLRNVDYRALRALPDSDQVLIKSAIEEGAPREALIDLLQEMAVKHHQERTALEGAVEEQAATIAAKDAVIETKAAKIAELDTRLKRVRTLPADQAAAEFRAELGAYAIEVETAIVNHLAPAIGAFKAHLAMTGSADADAYLDGVLSQIEARLRTVRDDNGLNQADATEWAGEGSQAPAWAQSMTAPAAAADPVAAN